MVAPSGAQYEITGGGYRAVVTECGAGLRLLEHRGRPLIDGYPESEMAYGARGQLLMPWPNRIRDGRYTVGGRELQLPLTEPSRQNASHGLVRWVAWQLNEHTDHSVTLTYRLMAQSGYPWTLDLQVSYDLGPEGLTVAQSATNAGDSAAAAAPYAQGAHPYLSVGTGPCDGWELTLPASTRSVSDPDRKLPVERHTVAGTEFDFRRPRPIGSTVIDHAFTDLERDERGRATVRLRHPDTLDDVSLWVDAAHGWLMIFTGDEPGAPYHRRALAVEPMTAQADAFRSGEDVSWLGPGETFSASWGIQAG